MKIRYAVGAAGTAALMVFGAAAAQAGPSATPFKSSGSGTETPSTAGCQFTSAGCTVQSTGTATSSHMGTGPYTSTLIVDWADNTSNGAGGFCAPATGTGTITAANGDTLDQSESGTVCEVGPTGPNVPHTFSNGTFTDTGGTGRFAHVRGGGTVTGGDDGQGNSSYQETGTISY